MHVLPYCSILLCFLNMQELQTALDRKRGVSGDMAEGEGPSSGKPRAKKRRKNKPDSEEI